MARLSLVCSAAMLSACVSAPVEQRSSNYPVQQHEFVGGVDLSGVERDAEIMRASMTRPAEGDFIAHAEAAPRIAIADQSTSRVIAHESPDTSISVNLASLPAEGGQIFTTQNAINDNGWRQTDGGYIHLYSGMACPSGISVKPAEAEEDADGVNMPLVNIRLFQEDGSDTACDYQNEEAGVFFTLYASHWPDESLDSHYGAALKLIVDRFSVVSEQPVVWMTFRPEDADFESAIEGETKVAGFLVSDGPLGGNLKTSLWLNRVGDWHVKARATHGYVMDGDKPELAQAEIMAAFMHAMELFLVDRKAAEASSAVQVRF